MFDPTTFALQVPGLDAAQVLYLTGEDTLLLGVFNSAAGVTVSLTGRFLPVPLPGDVQPPRVRVFRHDLIPATNRTLSTLTRSLGEGWLVDGAVQVTGGNPAHGQCYAIVSLQRGDTGALQVLSALARDYITANQRLGIVNNEFTGMADGAGALISVTGATPAAGAEISETMPTNTRRELIALRFSLVTSVAVANRFPQLILDDGANELTRIVVSAAEPASQTNFHSYGQGYPVVTQQTGFLLPLPVNIRLGSGYRIRTNTISLQAADQYSAPQYLVREWIEAN